MYFTDGCTDLSREAMDPGSIASQGGSVPEFLRKPIAICDFQGAGWGRGFGGIHFEYIFS